MVSKWLTLAKKLQQSSSRPHRRLTGKAGRVYSSEPSGVGAPAKMRCEIAGADGTSRISGDGDMSRRCELTGKGVLTGNNISHSHIRTRRRFLPNLVNVHLMSEVMGQRYRFRISAQALKTVEHRGGLDAFLLKAKDSELSPKALKLKKQIKARLAQQAEA